MTRLVLIISICICVQASAQQCAVTTPVKVLWLGDSITAGVVTPSGPPPTVLQTSLGSGYAVTNAGVAGDRVFQMHTRFETYRGQGYKVLIVLGGVNDFIVGGTDATVWTDYSVILSEARTDGMVVIPIYVLPWGAHSAWTSTKGGYTTALNARLASWCADNNLTYVDAYTAFGAGGTPANLSATYDSGDGLHPNTAGSALLANLVRSVLPR